jgi:hypothetical protein
MDTWFCEAAPRSSASLDLASEVRLLSRRGADLLVDGSDATIASVISTVGSGVLRGFYEDAIWRVNEAEGKAHVSAPPLARGPALEALCGTGEFEVETGDFEPARTMTAEELAEYLAPKAEAARVAMALGVRIPGDKAHATVLVLEPGRAYHFDPHGRSFFGADEMQRLGDALAARGFRFFPAHEMTRGGQALQGTDDPGLCATWSLIFLDHMLARPELPVLDLVPAIHTALRAEPPIPNPWLALAVLYGSTLVKTSTLPVRVRRLDYWQATGSRCLAQPPLYYRLWDADTDEEVREAMKLQGGEAFGTPVTLLRKLPTLEEWTAILEKGLGKDPRDRLRIMREMRWARAAENLRRGGGGGGGPGGSPQPLAFRTRTDSPSTAWVPIAARGGPLSYVEGLSEDDVAEHVLLPMGIGFRRDLAGRVYVERDQVLRLGRMLSGEA